MAKKKKKKFFDLPSNVSELKEVPTGQVQEIETGFGLDHRLLKRDLIRVFIIVSLFVGFLVGLYVVDKTSNQLTKISERISSGFIR